MSFEKRSPTSIIRFYCKLSVLLNLLTIVFGITYYLIPIFSNVYSIVGLLVFGSWILNIFLLYLTNEYLEKSNPQAMSINRFSYGYIIFFIIAILLMLTGISLLNFLTTGQTLLLGTIFFYFNMFIGLIGIAALGIYFALLISSNLETKGVWKFD